MAKGDVTVFEEFVDDLAKEIHNLTATDVLKLGLVNSVKTPLASEATPVWGDFSANEVGTGGGYTADGETLTFAVATRWAEVGGVGTLDADDVQFVQNGAGFTNARWGIIYNDTAASKQAIAFVDLGGEVSEQAGPVDILWSASGILTITANPV